MGMSMRMVESARPMSVPCPTWDRLAARLAALAVDGALGIAYSGGLDSRFLAHAARHMGLTPLLLHVSGPHIAPSETAAARAWAARHGLELREMRLDPLTHPAVAVSAEDRCYHCKHLLFSAMLAALPAGMAACDGGNTSDAGAYRPGVRAVRELGVHSPLAECGIGKEDIRRMARLSGMERPSQRARPCLLTRFAYGLKPQRELLERLAATEDAIMDILRPVDGDSEGPDFRLRVPREGAIELHMSVELDADCLRRIAVLAREHGLPEPVFRQVEAISGYFDTARGNPA